jgi:5-methylcytosine-specific restriction endonuclease McrA
MPEGLKGFQKGHKNFCPPKSQETKEKIRKALLGRKMSDEFRQKCRLRQLGKKPSSETIKKLVESRKNYRATNETKEKHRLSKLGSKNPMFGRKPSIEHRLKISESLKKVKAQLRDLNFNEVIHLIRSSPQTKIWREAVFKRDNYTCIWCGDRRGGNLNADHIKPFILIVRQNNIKTLEDSINCREFWDISNGRTLCKTCHKTTDTWGSKTRKLWK